MSRAKQILAMHEAKAPNEYSAVIEKTEYVARPLTGEIKFKFTPKDGLDKGELDHFKTNLRKNVHILQTKGYFIVEDISKYGSLTANGRPVKEDTKYYFEDFIDFKYTGGEVGEMKDSTYQVI